MSMWDPARERGKIMGRLVCWFNLHRWGYFIDGNVCRTCVRCPRVQYDLPWAPRHGAPVKVNRRRPRDGAKRSKPWI